MTKKIQSIGGQAVIEGVMIRSQTAYSIAVRTEKGGIKTLRKPFISAAKKSKFLSLPVVRGVVNLFEMLAIGFSALSISAKMAGKEGEQVTKTQMAGSILFAGLLTVALFIIAPYYLAKIFTAANTFLFNFIDGVFRMAIFLGYVAFISLMPDIRRVYQYHGAEHMAVHCFERGKKLTTANVKRFRTMHPRCGTSLIVFVIAVSILLFSIVRFEQPLYNILFRVLLIPIIGGISYEALKLSDKYRNNILVAAVIQPGIWVQYITTREPDKRQIDVAIAAVKKAV